MESSRITAVHQTKGKFSLHCWYSYKSRVSRNRKLAVSLIYTVDTMQIIRSIIMRELKRDKGDIQLFKIGTKVELLESLAWLHLLGSTHWLACVEADQEVGNTSLPTSTGPASI